MGQIFHVLCEFIARGFVPDHQRGHIGIRMSARGQVFHVADGCGDDEQDPPCRLGGVARSAGPAHDQDRAAEPGRRRGYR